MRALPAAIICCRNTLLSPFQRADVFVYLLSLTWGGEAAEVNACPFNVLFSIISHTFFARRSGLRVSLLSRHWRNERHISSWKLAKFTFASWLPLLPCCYCACKSFCFDTLTQGTYMYTYKPKWAFQGHYAQICHLEMWNADFMGFFTLLNIFVCLICCTDVAYTSIHMYVCMLI